jgi:tetratricopeptide (TPR) repeat protein
MTSSDPSTARREKLSPTAQQEQARLDDAIRRADQLLVSSLQGDERRRRHKRLYFLVSIGGAVMLAIVGTVLMFMFAQGNVEPAQKEQAAQLSAEGWQLWGKQDFAAATTRFAAAVKLDPRNTNAWNGLGWANLNSGNNERARAAFDEVLKLEPKHPAANNGRGQIALSERKYDEAEKYLLEAAPTAPAAWYGLARLYLIERKYEQAARWAKKVVDSGEGDEMAQQMLQAAEAKQLPDDLRRRIEPLATGSQGATAVEVGRAWQMMNQGRRDEAKAAFTAILAKAPQDGAALNGMGWLLLGGGDAAEAKPYFEKVLAADPTAAGAMNGMARVLKAQGDDAGAVKIWEEMVEKVPGPHAGTVGLADAYLEQKEYAKAIPLLEQLVKANPSDEQTKKKLKRAQAANSQ